MAETARTRYSLPARVLHWAMAFSFVFMWGSGYVMTTWVEEDSALEELLFDLHISVGVTLLVLLVVRVAVRLIYAPPPLPEGLMSRLEHWASEIGHRVLYALPLVVIALGWAETNLGGHTVQWFGVAMPTLLGEDELLGDLAATLHMWLAYAFLAAAAGHVLAALKHQWWDDHDILGRMTGRPG